MIVPVSGADLKILAIDTVTESCSVALSLRGVVTQRREIAAGHSRLVPGMVESLLRDAGLELKQLDALAVDIGPGSFTGVRIGIGVAQGLAYGAGLAVIPVGSLEALAHAVQPRAVHCATVLAAIDARMEQIYYGLYHNPRGGQPDETPRALIEPALASPQRLALGAREGIVGVGSGWDRYAPVLLEAANGAVSNWLAGRYPEAAAVARLAAARGLQSAVSPLRLTASYLRDEVATTPV